MPIVAGLAALIAGISLASYLGSFHWMLDNLASFRPQITLALLVPTVLLAIGRWRRWAMVMGVVSLLNLATIAPLFLPRSSASAANLRVLSFNLLSSNKSYVEVTEFLRTQEADLILLHEASLPWEEAVRAANLGYEIFINRHPDDIFGSLVLAPSGSVVDSFGFRIDDFRAVAVRLPSGTTVLGVHPLSPYSEERAELRDQQLSFASDWVKAQTGPVVVAGDFNAGPFSAPYRRLRGQTGLVDSIAGYGLENSYPATASPWLRVSIDQLLVTPEIEVVNRTLGPAMGSDHFPLTVDLFVPESVD